MKKNNDHGLYAISPSIDYKDFYLSYHKRKNPIILMKENELPKIKNTTIKTDTSTQDSKYDNNINTKNSILNLTDIDYIKTNSLNYSIITPFIKTNQVSYPKINPIFMQIKNYNSMYKTKIPKKLGKLSIKYIDLINMDQRSNLLIYEIKKNEKLLENDIISNIHDSSIKNKILDELKNIDNHTNQQIQNIMNNTTRQEKEDSLKYFKIQPKIINLCAEEIFKELKNKNAGGISSDITDKKIEQSKKNKIKKDKDNKDNKEFKENILSEIFLDFAKNNIRRKIELRNQFNQEISIEYIEKLLKNEIEKIKFIFALYLYNSENKNENNSLTEGTNNSSLIKEIKNKNLLDKSFNKIFKLKNYYNSLLSPYLKKRNNNLYIKNKNFFNTIDKSKLNNGRYNTDNEYINILMNQISNDDDDNKKTENGNMIKSQKERGLFHLYKKNLIYPYVKLTKTHGLDLNSSKNKNKKNLKPLIMRNSMNNDIDLNSDSKNKELNNKNDNNNNKKIKDEENNKNIDIKNLKNEEENNKTEPKINKEIINTDNNIKNNNNINNNSKENIILNLNNPLFLKEIEHNYKKKINNNINKKDNNILNKTNIENIEKNKENMKEKYKNEDVNYLINNNQHQKKDNDNFNNNDNNNDYNNNEGNDYDNNEGNDYNNSIDNFNDYDNNINIELNKNNENNDENISENEEKDTINNYTPKYKENNNFLDIMNSFKEEDNEPIANNNEIHENENIKRNKKNNRTYKTNLTIKMDKVRPIDKKLTMKNISHLYNDKNNKNELYSSIIHKNLVIKKKISTKNTKKFKKINYIQGRNKNRVLTTKEKPKSINIPIKISHNFIKNFEIINLEDKRNLSEGNIINAPNINESNEVNIIKLQDTDIDKIVDFVNEEEKRRIKNEKNAVRIEKEKIEKKDDDNLHSLFKEKKEEENGNDEDLTRDDLVEKLKKDDSRIRKYVEGIIRSGLTIGNKKLNKQLKNNSILVYKDYNLGQFKFNKNKNFGIKDEINFELFRPLSGKDKEQENKEKNKEEEEKTKKIQKKEKKEKKEEPKKELIYDNKYLFTKKKSVRFILRKEVEEILNGGILLQKQEIEEQTKNEEKPKKLEIPEKKEFVKRKGNKYKLLKKSEYLIDLIDEEEMNRIKEEQRILNELRIKEEMKEQKLNNKINMFIKKIQNLKKEDIRGFNQKEMDIYMNERFNADINERERKEKENRINDFLSTLNDYRYTKKRQREINDTYLYKEPILVENLIVENFEGNKTYRSSKKNNNKLKNDIYYSNKIVEKYKKRSKSYLTEIDY